MSKPKDHYWGDIARSIDLIKEWAKSNKFSCQHQPLINIPLENVVLDELQVSEMTLYTFKQCIQYRIYVLA